MKHPRLPSFSFVLACLCLVSCTDKKIEKLLQPSEALGTVAAEEAIKFAGANKTIAAILPDANWSTPSTAEVAFRSTLKAKGYTLVVAKAANLGDPMSSARSGLRPEDFFEAVQNSAGAGAIVSIAGAPRMTPADAGRLKPDHPPIIVVATSRLGETIGLRGDLKQLEDLIDAKVIQEAIIDAGLDAGSAPAPASDAIHTQFDENYRILRLP